MQIFRFRNIKLNHLLISGSFVLSTAFGHSLELNSLNDISFKSHTASIDYSVDPLDKLSDDPVEKYLNAILTDDEIGGETAQASSKSEPKIDVSNLKEGESAILPEADKTPNCPINCDAEGYTMNFKDVTFLEYMHFLNKLTNVNFIYNSEDVQFTVSVMAEEPTSIEQVRTALLQILRVQGLTLVEDGNNMIISKDPTIASVAPVVSDEMENVCENSEAMITRVFRLKNINADKIAAIVTGMVSKGALVEASEVTHHLIVTDLKSNVDKIADLLKSLNNPQAAFEIGVFHADKTYIDNLIPLAEQILAPMAEGNPITMVAQGIADTIFIISTPYLVQKSIEVLRTLDSGFEGSDVLPNQHLMSQKFLLYKLHYHKGDMIQQTLQDLGTDLDGKDTNQLLVNTINTAQWVESTNSLLFVGDPPSLDKIKQLVEALDVPLRQVFIEVLAIRTSINNSLSLGVQWGYRGLGAERVSSVGSLLTSPNNTVAGSALKPNIFTEGLDRISGPGVPVPRTGNAMGLNAGVIGNVMFSGGNLFFDIAALVDALQTDTETQVITNPKLVTQDTIPATFYVGSTRPFQTNSILQASGSSSGNFVTASIEYRRLGLSLTVTPYLGLSDMITLEIEQSTSDFVSNAISNGGSGSSNFAIVPVTNDSSITTRVQIPNKHFLMISGMVEDVKTANKTAIPCVGGIPFIGDLLGVKSSSVQKDNLIIFLRPHIIDTVQELDEITLQQDQFYREKSEQAPFMKNSIDLYRMSQ